MAPYGRAIFRSLLVGIAGVLVSSVASGQTPADPPYPGQAVRLVVPFSAGSVTDLLARKDRFNVPGTATGSNWSRRMSKTMDELSKSRTVRKRMRLIRELLESTGRIGHG